MGTTSNSTAFETLAKLAIEWEQINAMIADLKSRQQALVSQRTKAENVVAGILGSEGDVARTIVCNGRGEHVEFAIYMDGYDAVHCRRLRAAFDFPAPEETA